MPTKAILVYLGLGGNLGNVERQFELARQVLSSQPDISGLRSSSNFRSKPWGGGIIDVSAQDDYLNQVLELRTILPAEELLKLCHKIEVDAGRDQTAKRFSARPLDIDILIYGQLQLNSMALVIPHPRMLQRAFVLKPLAELNLKLDIPGAGRVQDALDLLSAEELNTTQRVLND